MPDFSSLTVPQREIHDFIRERIEKRGFPPTVREIGEAFEIQSPNGVMCHLKALEKKGVISRTGFRARAMELVDYRPGEDPLLALAVVGLLQANAFLTAQLAETEEQLAEARRDLEAKRDALQMMKEQQRCPDCERRRAEW